MQGILRLFTLKVTFWLLEGAHFGLKIVEPNLFYVNAGQESGEAPVNREPALKNQVAPAGIERPDSQEGQEEDSNDTIPVKGTLISAGFVVLMIFMNIISVGIKMEDLTRTLIIKLLTELFRALRCPLIAFVTYRARKNRTARMPN